MYSEINDNYITFYYYNETVDLELTFEIDKHLIDNLRAASNRIDVELSLDPYVKIEQSMLRYHAYVQDGYNLKVFIPFTEYRDCFYEAYKEMKESNSDRKEHSNSTNSSDSND
jgi:hypothetical protein